MESLRSTPPQVAKLAAQSPTQFVKARTPDKLLPVQEELEQDDSDEQNDNREQECDRWTPGRSEYERYVHRYEPEVRDPERQLHSTASPTPSSDILLKGYDPRYDTRHERHSRENHSQVQRKNSDERKQNHDGDEECAQNSNRIQFQDEEGDTVSFRRLTPRV